ncbi:MAG TPA: hypothetical protein VFO85_07685 [Vicinamibacteria bacterium]|nr:hypothetical protein [Vicinamibacteria bacterium]
MRLGLVAALAAFLLAAGGARADEEGSPNVGAAVGYSSQFDRPFLALDLLAGTGGHWTVVPNVSFVETGALNRWTIGVELQWNAPAYRVHRKMLGWAGAGLAVVTEDPKGPLNPTTRDLVSNIVLGVGYDAPATPFLQLRVTLRDPSDAGLSVGVRF